MNFPTLSLFAVAPLFGADALNSTAIFSIAALCLYVAFLFVSRRFVGDIFRNDSPAQSPKRLVPWSVGAAFAVFVCGAILFPLFAANAIAFLPQSWFPNFASVQSVAAPVDAPDAEQANPAPNADEQANSDPNADKQADSAPNADEQTNTDPNVDAPDAKNLATQHPLARLLIRSRSTPWAFETLLLCFFVAVIAAPFAEEFLFRVLFQGTLENYALQAILPPPGAPRRPFVDAESTAKPASVDRAFPNVDAESTAKPASVDRAFPNADAESTAKPASVDQAFPNADSFPNGADANVASAAFSNGAAAPAAPSATEFRWTDPTTPMERRAFYLRSAFAILVPAFVFGLIHAGAPETPEEARDPETLNRLFRTMFAAGVANVAALVFGLCVLRRSTGATTGDVGLGPEFTYKAGRCFASLRRFALDFYRGVVVFAFIAPVVFGANATLRLLFPNAIVDPIPIFIFALAEGVVYWRLRRYATVVGMHVALNATSFALLCAFL
ncbi:MAG: CPBP family intramembrane metalloprotease [Thermoguttaceae bacterium]|nr:CPBP family intramembrane metalloprotease [Thermoguttaceae bacterium]